MKTLIIGASLDSNRYSYKAANMLSQYHHDIEMIGRDKGELLGKPIENKKMIFYDIHTVTLYINPRIQKEYYDYIVSLKPKRIIFNPGTENEEFKAIARKNNIEAIEACTLVLLRTNQF
jgi:predicted CoA-binding protein